MQNLDDAGQFQESAQNTAVDGGRKKWEFADGPVISTYIYAVVAGPYASRTDTHTGAAGEVPLGVFCRASMEKHLDSEELFTLTKQGLAFYEDFFGMAYPFGKYDQIWVPDFNEVCVMVVCDG